MTCRADLQHASLSNTAINGSAEGDIIGSAGVDVIDANAGNDTITLGGSGDTVIYTSDAAGAATDGIDTITDFTVGTDKLDIVTFVPTKASLAAGTTVIGTATSADADVTLDVTKDVVEIVGTLQSTIVDFNNDSQVLDAIVGDGNALKTSAAAGKVIMVVYQDDNAYIYTVNAGAGNDVVAVGEITLIAVLEDIGAGDMTNGDFI